MKSRWRTWNDSWFLHLDYAGFKSDVEALRAEVNEADLEITRQKPGRVLVLIDLRDTVASAAVVNLFKESAPRTSPFIRRHALLGITGIKRFLAHKVAVLMGRPMRLFDSEEAALDWLTAEDGSSSDGADLVGLPGAPEDQRKS